MKKKLHSDAKTRGMTRRMASILAICAMLAAPLALVARGEACSSSCTMMCCMMMQHHAKIPSGSTHCQGSESSGWRCGMNATCNGNHALDYGFAMPLPLSTTIAPFRLGAPVDFRSSISVTTSDSLIGVIAPPFEPPR